MQRNRVQYDISALHGFSMDESEIIDFIHEFVQQSEKDLRNLAGYIHSKNADEIRNTLHRMKNILLLLKVDVILQTIVNAERMNNSDGNFYTHVETIVGDLQELVETLRKSVLNNIR